MNGNESESRRKFADINMTQDEMSRFSEAMKKEEFRKLLVEYAEELSDPTNRAQYEKEIAQLEEERGMNVTFIHPEAGFCLKTTQNGDMKCFINICKNGNIEKPTSKNEVHKSENGKSSQGLLWEIPHTCSPLRNDTDHEKNKCVVYDVVFHPDSYRMGETNARFKNLLKDSAMDTIEKSYGVKLDRVNAKVLQKLDFKGMPTACVIKKKIETFSGDKIEDNDPIKPLIDQIREHDLDKQLGEKLSKKPNNQETKVPTKDIPVANQETPISTHTKPTYSILHRGMPEMGDHAMQLDTTHISSTRPKEIVVSIELPLLKSSQNCTLDVFENFLEMGHEDPNYQLNLKLPYPVREIEAKAKFDKVKRCLNVTLPVIPYVGNIEKNYAFPLSSDSSNSNSLSEISDNTPIQISSTTPVDLLSVEVLEPLKVLNVKNDLKYTLPTRVTMSETDGYLSMRFGVNNYVKDSIRIRIEDDESVSMSCESCSLSGCYITYYSVFIQLETTRSRIDTDLLSEHSRLINDFDELKTASLNFNDNDIFELKLKKSLDKKSRSESSVSTALISLCREDEASRTQINIEQDSTEEKVEQTLICESRVNNMSRKDYIINFKDIIADKPESLDEDDDDIEDEPEHPDTTLNNHKKIHSKNTITNEKLKFQQRCNITPELDTKNTNSIYSDVENDYLQNHYQYEENMNEENDECENPDKKSSDTSSLGSSLNSNSSTQLKGILKKPRSVSESESSSHSHNSFSHTFSKLSMKQTTLASSLDESCCDNSNSEDNLQGSKKSVSFNNQVVRNVFKSTATIIGMKKPNSQKNRKKNQRKRTISDPSYDCFQLQDGGHNNSSSSLRNRSISESSDDFNRHTNTGTSGDSVYEEEGSGKSDAQKPSKKSKKKSKKNAAKKSGSDASKTIDLNNNSSKVVEESVNKFDTETMLQWKNQGLLPDDSELNHGTECAFKFKNKLLNDLDD